MEEERLVQKIMDKLEPMFEQIKAKFSDINQRFEKMDERFEKMDERFEKMDARFEKMDARFDEINGRMGNFEVTQDQIISKLVDMDDKIGEMATKDELKDTERRLMDVLDEHSVILRRLDDERIVDSGRITRVENEVKKIKFQTSRP